MSIEVRVLSGEDHALLATAIPGVFDHAIDPAASKEFLSDSRHHVAVAIDEGAVVGFVSAVHYIHPDKPRPELWIDEVGVAPTHIQRGIAKALMNAMFDHGRSLGCAESWVLTDRRNAAAMRLYESVGGVEPDPETVYYTFALNGPAGKSAHE